MEDWGIDNFLKAFFMGAQNHATLDDSAEGDQPKGTCADDAREGEPGPFASVFSSSSSGSRLALNPGAGPRTHLLIPRAMRGRMDSFGYMRGASASSISPRRFRSDRG